LWSEIRDFSTEKKLNESLVDEGMKTVNEMVLVENGILKKKTFAKQAARN
jgi:hypothetical protein